MRRHFKTVLSLLLTVDFGLLHSLLQVFVCTPAGAIFGVPDGVVDEEQQEPKEQQKCHHNPNKKQPENLVHCCGHKETEINLPLIGSHCLKTFGEENKDDPPTV